jgi:hypothetical protein
LRVRIAAGWFSILLISALSGYSLILMLGKKKSFFETVPIAGCVSLVVVGFRAVDEWSE